MAPQVGFEPTTLRLTAECSFCSTMLLSACQGSPRNSEHICSLGSQPCIWSPQKMPTIRARHHAPRVLWRKRLGPSGATEKCDPVRRIPMDSGSLSHANSGCPRKTTLACRRPLGVSGTGDAQAIQRPSRAAEPSQAIKWARPPW